MFDSVSLPRWLYWLMVVLSSWAAVALVMLPGMRWWLRRRANRVIDELNQRLRIRLQPFKLTRREVLIDRLVHDPEVAARVAATAAEEGTDPTLVAGRVETYAREIVPSFNAFAYFRLGYWLARRVTRFLYRVRLGAADERALTSLPEDASVVFVMNHRSNLDYLLVPHLVASSTALSYAVGEWARVWPLRNLVRIMGGFFVRRRSRDGLYRKVLERYVQLATASGVTQAVFPEGRLTLDGRLGEARKGILRYLTLALGKDQGRDIVFVPVGLNYDRVLEDRRQLLAGNGEAPGRLYTAWSFLRFAGGHALQRLVGRGYRFGYAAVTFGRPLSLEAFLGPAAAPPSARSEADLREVVDRLGDELMERIGEVVPVLPVALVSTVLRDAEGPLDELELEARVFDWLERLGQTRARVHLPRGDRAYAMRVGLRMLTLRRVVLEEEGLYRIAPGEEALLAYYAGSIEHITSPIA